MKTTLRCLIHVSRSVHRGTVRRHRQYPGTHIANSRTKMGPGPKNGDQLFPIHKHYFNTGELGLCGSPAIKILSARFIIIIVFERNRC